MVIFINQHHHNIIRNMSIWIVDNLLPKYTCAKRENINQLPNQMKKKFRKIYNTFELNEDLVKDSKGLSYLLRGFFVPFTFCHHVAKLTWWLWWFVSSVCVTWVLSMALAVGLWALAISRNSLCISLSQCHMLFSIWKLNTFSDEPASLRLMILTELTRSETGD